MVSVFVCVICGFSLLMFAILAPPTPHFKRGDFPLCRPVHGSSTGRSRSSWSSRISGSGGGGR